MSVSTKKGDKGYTRTLGGDFIPKHNLVIEAGGAIDEANAQLGLARSISGDRRIKRILLQLQKDLFKVGADLSSSKEHSAGQRQRISEQELEWVEMIAEQYEEALSLPPGFVTFGQLETSSQLDVARTYVRRSERLASRMKDEGLLHNDNVLKYLNRLSDLIFLLACFEEKPIEEKARIRRRLFKSQLSDPFVKRTLIIMGAVFFAMTITIFSLLLFHGTSGDMTNLGQPGTMEKYMEDHMGLKDKVIEHLNSR